MKIKQIEEFTAQLGWSDELRSRIASLHGDSGQVLAEALSKLSIEAGTPLSVEEWAEIFDYASDDELISDEALSSVSGGTGGTSGSGEVFERLINRVRRPR